MQRWHGVPRAYQQRVGTDNVHPQAGEQVPDEPLDDSTVQAQPEAELVVVELCNMALICVQAHVSAVGPPTAASGVTSPAKRTGFRVCTMPGFGMPVKGTSALAWCNWKPGPPLFKHTGAAGARLGV